MVIITTNELFNSYIQVTNFTVNNLFPSYKKGNQQSIAI